MSNDNFSRLPGSPGCFVCDNNSSNPRSLGITLLWDEQEQTVRIPCAPDQTWCGFSDVVHGGLICSVLDEAMAWAAKEVSGDWAFTADFQVRFKKVVAPGKQYQAIGKVVENQRRKLVTEGLFMDEQGQVLAQATAVFLRSGQAKTRVE